MKNYCLVLYGNVVHLHKTWSYALALNLIIISESKDRLPGNDNNNFQFSKKIYLTKEVLLDAI